MTKNPKKPAGGFFPDPPKTRYNKDSLIHHIKSLDNRQHDLYRDGAKWTPREYSLLLDGFLLGHHITSLVSTLHRSRDSLGTQLRKLCYCYQGGIEIKDISRNRTERTGHKITKEDRYCLAMATGEAGRKYGAIKEDTDYLGAVLGRSSQDALLCLHLILDERDRVGQGGFFDKDKERSRWMKLPQLVREVGAYLNDEAENFYQAFLAYKEASTEIDKLVAAGAVKRTAEELLWL